jgi:hypothetical protein
MNKKLNTVLFVLGATLFNILITVLFFVVLLIAYTRLFMQHLPPGAQAWSFPIIFIAAIALSFVVYRLALKLFLKKVEMEKYFVPIFSGKKADRR